MAHLFDTYEEEFHLIRSGLEQRIRNIPTYNGDKREAEIQEAESNLQEAEQIAESMRLSARNVSSNDALITKVSAYESEVQKFRVNLRKAKMEFQAGNDRDSLFSGLRQDPLSSSMEQRERLLTATERLERSHVDLKDSIRNAEEMTEIGIEVMDNLDRQRDTMIGMRGKLAEVNTNLRKARRIMNSMARRMITNKLILAVITLVLLGGIVLVVYFKWFSGSDSDTPPTE